MYGTEHSTRDKDIRIPRHRPPALSPESRDQTVVDDHDRPSVSQPSPAKGTSVGPISVLRCDRVLARGRLKPLAAGPHSRALSLHVGDPFACSAVSVPVSRCIALNNSLRRSL